MLVVVPDRNGRQFVYTLPNIGPDTVADCIAAMKAYGVSGGRYVNDRLEVADKNGLWRNGMTSVAEAMHKPLGRGRARITWLEGDEPGKADYQWTGPR